MVQSAKNIIPFISLIKYDSRSSQNCCGGAVKFFLAVIFLWGLAIEAKLEDHFKAAAEKSDAHTMKNIDFIYVLNLDQRPEKFQRTLQQLELWGITPYRFSAINGWELTTDVVAEVGVNYQPWMSTGAQGTYYEKETWKNPQHEYVYKVGRTYFCHCMSLGAIGIVLSHLSILQDAYDSGYETIWVMEDDIDILRNPHLLSDLIDQLDETVGKEGWDILFTDQDTKNTLGNYVPCTGFAWRPNYTPSDPERFAKRYAVGSDFRRVGARFGAYSMIVRRSAMKKILDFFKAYHVFLPYDIDFTFPLDLKLLTVLVDIVSTLPGAPSDNGSPAYKYREK
jgi:GR25 family glycosyltransferase involved in LPS biosynthesis